MGAHISGHKGGRLPVLAHLPFEVALVACLAKIAEGDVTTALVVLLGGVAASLIAVTAIRRL